MKSYILPISIILIIAVLIGSVVLVLINLFKGSDESIIKKDNAPLISPKSSFSVPFRYTESLTVSSVGENLAIKPLNAHAAEPTNGGENRVKYVDAYQNTDVVQAHQGSKLKEDIILKKPGHPEKFEYQIDMKELDFEKVSNGDINFFEKGHRGDSGYKKFTILGPYMIDASGKQSSTSQVQTTMSENGFLTVEPSKDWLAEAAYPVTLDPTVEISILNVHSHPQQGELWEVFFTTVGKADLKIIPADQSTIDDDEFRSLSCGDMEFTPKILSGDVIYYPNWECDETARIVHYTKVAGNHTLRFEFGDKTEYAYNSSSSWNSATTGTSWQVPDEVTSITTKCWGGGGGGGGGGDEGGGSGGGGGAATSTISVTPGETLSIMVGGGGGGGGSNSDAGAGGGGGGYSAIKRGETILMQCAGGGGGGGGGSTDVGYAGGAGGGSTGVSGSGSGGGGGTQTEGGSAGSGSPSGTAGSANTGGLGGDDGSDDGTGGTNGGGVGGGHATEDGCGGGGGGAGKYGGGGGGAQSDGASGGGGGSSSGDSLYSGSGRNSGNNSDSDYAGSAGYGGNGGPENGGSGSSGNSGLVVVVYTLPVGPSKSIWKGDVILRQDVRL